MYRNYPYPAYTTIPFDPRLPTNTPTHPMPLP